MRHPHFEPTPSLHAVHGVALDVDEPTGDGPGLFVSRAFWAGGALSLALWGCATWLVLAFV